MKSRLVEIRHGDMRALVYPERGFQLYGFERDFGRGDPFPAIYAPSLDAEPDQRRYGNPVLFPCCGISSHAGGTDLWSRAGKTWPMPGHGFARNHYWRILDAREDRVTAELTPTHGSRILFPFEFRLELTYRLDAQGLLLDARVENPGREAFPYALGFHPYLRLPRRGDGAFGKFSVELPRGTRHRSSDGWQTMSAEIFPGRLIHNEEISDAIVLSDCAERRLRLAWEEAGRTITVSTGQSPEPFPWWAIWRPSVEAEYLCLEPWTETINALNRSATRRCAPGETHCYRMDLTIE